MFNIGIFTYFGDFENNENKIIRKSPNYYQLFSI